MDGMPQFGDPGTLLLLQRAACLHIKYENEQGGKESASRVETDFSSPMPNECHDLAVRKLFSFPHAQIFASHLSKNVLRACTRLLEFRKNMAGEGSF